MEKIDRDIEFFKTKKIFANKNISFNNFNSTGFYLIGEIKNKNLIKIISRFSKKSKPVELKNVLTDKVFFSVKSDIYNFRINNYVLTLNRYFGLFGINELCEFLEKIISFQKIFICTIFENGNLINILSIPVEEDKIHTIITDEYDLYRKFYESGIRYKFNDIKILEDFIVDKKQLIKEFNEQFKIIHNAKIALKLEDTIFYDYIKYFDEFIKSSKNCLIKEGNYECLYKFDLMYKTKDNEWKLKSVFDKVATGKNIKKECKKAIENNKISEYKYKAETPHHSYRYLKGELATYPPNKFAWFYNNWVQEHNTGNWFPKNEIMPEPEETSLVISNFKDIKFDVNFLETIEDYRLFLNKLAGNKNFHMAFFNEYKGYSAVFNVWNKENGNIRILFEKYKFEYRKDNYEKVFDITIPKKTFINNFKKLLNDIDVINFKANV